MREIITIPLTRDEWSVILESLDQFDYDRLKAWQLDDFDSGTDKADLLTRIEDKIRTEL
jgi:hypothetical protein